MERRILLAGLAVLALSLFVLSGTGDARITAAMPAIDSIMRALHKDYTGKNYEGAIHGFLRAQDDPKTGRASEPPPPRDPVEEAANMAATKDGWPKTIAFLRKNLGVN